MERWQAQLDRYLTQEPPDDFTPYVEQVVNEICKVNSDWDLSGNFLDSIAGENILSYLFNKSYSPVDAAKLIYKTFPNK